MRSSCAKLRYRNCLTPADPFELVLHHVKGREVGLHEHDFAELLWVDTGSCRHVWNGVEHVLRARDLALIAPEDQHSLKAYRGEGVLCYNLAFAPKVLRTLVRRYRLADDPFWGTAPPVARLRRLSAERAAWLTRQFRELQSAPRTVMALEHFLMGVMLGLGREGSDPFASCPDWLQDACAAAMQDPAALSEGTQALSRLSGRSVEHVSRVMRERTGRTPIEWITEWRLGHASSLLARGDTPIGELALACGFSSLSHFYKLFSKRFKMTPRRFRARQRFMLPETGGSR